jgi:hypothetical protein
LFVFYSGFIGVSFFARVVTVFNAGRARRRADGGSAWSFTKRRIARFAAIEVEM